MDTIEKKELKISLINIFEDLEGIFDVVDMLASRFDLGISIDREEIENKDGSMSVFIKIKTNDED